MSHDLPVSPITASPGTTSHAPRDDRTQQAAPTPAPSARPLPNPSLRLDAGLGMVVLEFRDDAGAVTDTIPSQRILQAYHARTEPPPGTTSRPQPVPTMQPEDENSERFA